MIIRNKIHASASLRIFTKLEVWRRLLFYSTVVILIFLLASCGYESPKYKMLSAQCDSIRIVQWSLERDVNEYMQVFTHIEKSIDKITANEADHIQQIKTKLNEKDNAMINNNIAKINTLIQSGHNETEALKKQLRQSAFKAKELERNIESLNLMLQEETMKTVIHQNEIKAKDSTLAVLDKKVQELTFELISVNNEIEEQADLIAQYKDELFTGYYITGSKSELRNKNILTKGGLCKTVLFQEEVDKNIFSKVNTLETTVIPLPSTVKGKLLSSHPKSSYKFAKHGDEKVVEILNPEKFWSTTKYLVIQ